jgi:Preprotein translocase subunit SecA (ATPase, RNA helicase)
MLGNVLSGMFGTRHDRERKRVQPIVDEINERYAPLETVSEEELRGRTAKFRERIHEVTSGIEARIADIKERKRSSTDPAERDELDNELSGVDGRGGAEAELRTAIADSSTSCCPRFLPPCARHAAVC